MQTTFLALLLAAASQVSAQALPACADTCVTAQLSRFNCASELDFGCVCTPAFNAAVTPCVLSSCNAQDIATTSSLNGAACAAYALRRASGSSAPNLLATTTGAGAAGAGNVVAATDGLAAGANAQQTPMVAAVGGAAMTTGAAGAMGSLAAASGSGAAGGLNGGSLAAASGASGSGSGSGAMGVQSTLAAASSRSGMQGITRSIIPGSGSSLSLTALLAGAMSLSVLGLALI